MSEPDNKPPNSSSADAGTAPVRLVEPRPEQRGTSLLVLGKPESGKTALMAAMKMAVDQQQTVSAGWNCNIHSVSEQFMEVYDIFMEARETGKFEASSNRPSKENPSGVIIHELTLVAEELAPPGFRLKRPPPYEIRISLPDYPGGATMPNEPGLFAAKQEITERMKTATGIIICLPEDDAEGSSKFIRGIMSIMGRMPNGLPLRYVAFALTKLDAHDFRGRKLMQLGRAARAQISAGSSVEAIMNRLENHGYTLAFRNCFAQKAPNVIFAAGRTSVFGFTSLGNCNFDPDWNGLLIRANDSRDDEKKNRLYRQGTVNDEWHPYQVLDPFLFAAFGKLPHYQRDKNGGVSREGDGFVRLP